MTAEPTERRRIAPPTTNQALVDLLGWLAQGGYEFITPTPSTHRLVSGRRDRARRGDLRDVLGWSLPFGRDDVHEAVFDLLKVSGALQATGGLYKSTVRVSTLDDRLHLHSAPGSQRDAVFLGPDSYRFVRFLRAELEQRPHFTRAVDVGVGAGAGALMLASRNPTAEVYGTDINELALSLFAANARHAALPAGGVHGSGFGELEGDFDLVITNPPYIAGEGARIYRDGGPRGTELGLSWVDEAANRLKPQGRIILYTGSPISGGQDPVREALQDLATPRGLSVAYEEIDPDVFGGTLHREAYRDVERIAAIGAVLSAP